jgi:hypothetical protein
MCIGVCLWGTSIGATYWDLNRRALPRREAQAWLALVSLVPILGMLAYLLSRLMDRAFPVAMGVAPAGAARRRVTRLKRPPEAAPRTGTIAAADLVNETIAALPTEALPIAALSKEQMKVTLAVTAGPHAGGQWVIQRLPASIGRGGEAALRLDRDRGVSRKHAEIYCQPGGLFIRDLGSHHGTLVNGARIDDHPLQVDDKIELGNSTLIVKAIEP